MRGILQKWNVPPGLEEGRMHEKKILRGLNERKARISSREPSSMTAGQINKELDRLEDMMDDLNDEFIKAGRGHERPSEIRGMSDPLATRAKAIWDRRSALQIEIEARYGPRPPSRLPRGFGPRSRR